MYVLSVHRPARVSEAWKSFFCSLRSLWGSLGGVGRVGKTWSLAGECFGKAWGMGDLGNAWECSKEARGRLGGLGGFGECSQDALRSLGGAYELVP